MASRRLLLMHVTTSSGHHHASRAIAQALRRLDPDCQAISVDAFDYTSRVVRWAIMRSYLSVIRHQPNVWEYLYDNPTVHRHVQQFRQLLHRYHARKLQRLLETVQPHAIACTQAFPCGMIADYQQHHGLRIPLVGVLTDFAPHLYWLHDTVDAYVVPAEEVKERFVSYGISPERIHAYGIPITPTCVDPVDREAVFTKYRVDPQRPVILIMGGGGGFGPIRELMQSLDRLSEPCQFIVLAGTNHALLTWLRHRTFGHPLITSGYVDDVPQLMEIATLIITKPGGLTTAEALAKQLPMLMITPIPGQEMCNARFLLTQEAAVSLDAPERAGEVVSQLLRSPDTLRRIRERMKSLGRPASAFRAAHLLMAMADQYEAATRRPPQQEWEGVSSHA